MIFLSMFTYLIKILDYLIVNIYVNHFFSNVSCHNCIMIEINKLAI